MASTAKLDASTILPRTEWRTVLCETAVEVFSTMAGVTVVAPQVVNEPTLEQMTGVIGIAGQLRAIFSLRCSQKFALAIASQMLGIPIDDPGAEKAAGDTVGEICNVVAGYFKAKVGFADKGSLSLPTIVIGKNYTIHPATGCERIEVSLLFESDPLRITLDIRE
jgi:CheY-specific phosphatase CheX